MKKSGGSRVEGGKGDVFPAEAVEMVRRGQERYFTSKGPEDEGMETGGDASVNNLTLMVSYWGDREE